MLALTAQYLPNARTFLSQIRLALPFRTTNSRAFIHHSAALARLYTFLTQPNSDYQLWHSSAEAQEDVRYLSCLLEDRATICVNHVLGEYAPAENVADPELAWRLYCRFGPRVRHAAIEQIVDKLATQCRMSAIKDEDGATDTSFVGRAVTKPHAYSSFPSWSMHASILRRMPRVDLATVMRLLKEIVGVNHPLERTALIMQGFPSRMFDVDLLSS